MLLKTTAVLHAGPHTAACRQYLVVKALGAGQYGSVKLVVDVADLQPYALKTVSKVQLQRSLRRMRSSLGRTSLSG